MCCQFASIPLNNEQQDLGEVKLRTVEFPGKSPLAEGTLEEGMAELHVLVAACQW